MCHPTRRLHDALNCGADRSVTSRNEQEFDTRFLDRRPTAVRTATANGLPLKHSMFPDLLLTSTCCCSIPRKTIGASPFRSIDGWRSLLFDAGAVTWRGVRWTRHGWRSNKWISCCPWGCSDVSLYKRAVAMGGHWWQAMSATQLPSEHTNPSWWHFNVMSGYIGTFAAAIWLAQVRARWFRNG